MEEQTNNRVAFQKWNTVLRSASALEWQAVHYLVVLVLFGKFSHANDVRCKWEQCSPNAHLAPRKAHFFYQQWLWKHSFFCCFIDMVCEAESWSIMLGKRWFKVAEHLVHSWPLELVFDAEMNTDLKSSAKNHPDEFVDNNSQIVKFWTVHLVVQLYIVSIKYYWNKRKNEEEK